MLPPGAKRSSSYLVTDASNPTIPKEWPLRAMPSKEPSG
jgi:hypothetical protein